MAQRWQDREIKDLEGTRDELVYVLIRRSQGSVSQSLAQKSDTELLADLYDSAETCRAIQEAGLSQQDVERGLRQV